MSRIPLVAPIRATAACLMLSACGADSSHNLSTGGTAPAPSIPPPAINHPPVLGGTPAESTTVDSSWQFLPFASDPDGDPMQFFVENAPPWTEFDAATGLLAGIPGEGDLRRYDDIRISVTDGVATTSLPPFSIEVLPQGSPGGSATLSWTPPSERVDGTPIGNLAGYRVLYGQSSGEYELAIQIDNPSITRYVVENLGPGDWFFAVTVRTADGLESAPSAEVSKRIES